MINKVIIESLVKQNQETIEFFNIEEFNYFKYWANRVYDKTNDEHTVAKREIVKSVWNKTQYWSNEVISRLNGFETSNGRYWSKRAQHEGKTVSAFKPYTWARIYRKGDKKKDIFFTVGIDTNYNALDYKLDFQRESDSKLSLKQNQICSKFIPPEKS